LDISDFTVGDNGNLYTNTDFVDRQGPVRFKVQVTDTNHVSSNNKEALVIIYVSIVRTYTNEPTLGRKHLWKVLYKYCKICLDPLINMAGTGNSCF
jgi:hypothetical protein